MNSSGLHRSHVSWAASRYVLPFFVGSAIVFALGSSFLEKLFPIAGTVVAGGVVLLSGFLLFCVGWGKNRVLGMLGMLIVIAVIFSCINVLVSQRRLLSLFKCLSWVAAMAVSRELAASSAPSTFEKVRQWMPVLLAGVGGAMLVQGFMYVDQDPEVLLKRQHMSATYLGLAMAVGIFSQKLVWRVFWVVVGVSGIYVSASRGAMLSLPMAIVGYGVYLVLSKRPKDAVAMVVLAAVIGTVFLDASIRDAFFAKKKRTYSDAYASLEAGFEQRLFLTEEAWKIAVANPLGTGAGQTYQIIYGEKRLGAHNGYLDTLVQIGFPAAILLFGWYAMLVVRVLRNPHFSLRAKATFMTYLLVLHVRALGESYSIFDSASFYVLLLWYMTWYGVYEAGMPAWLPGRSRASQFLRPAAKHGRQWGDKGRSAPVLGQAVMPVSAGPAGTGGRPVVRGVGRPRVR